MIKICTIKSLECLENIRLQVIAKKYFAGNFSLTFFVGLFVLLSISCNTQKSTTSSKGTSEFYTNYSKKLGVTLNGDEDKKFIEAIVGWIGMPYVYGGESKKGTDCSGLVQTLFKDVYNIKLKRTAYDQIDDCSHVAKRNLKSRDLVFFKINSKKISHVGIYIAKNKFIHASLKGVMVSDITDAYYSKYYYSGGRIKNLK